MSSEILNIVTQEKLVTKYAGVWRYLAGVQ